MIKQTTHYRWNGNEWVGGTSVSNTEARGDFKLSSELDVSYLLAYKEETDGVVAWWNSTDGGASFMKGDELLRRENSSWAISSIIRNAHPDAQVIVAEKPPGSDFRYMYLLGEGGPVPRDRSDATLLERKNND